MCACSSFLCQRSHLKMSSGSNWFIAVVVSEWQFLGSPVCGFSCFMDNWIVARACLVHTPEYIIYIYIQVDTGVTIFLSRRGILLAQVSSVS